MVRTLTATGELGGLADPPGAGLRALGLHDPLEDAAAGGARGVPLLARAGDGGDRVREVRRDDEVLDAVEQRPGAVGAGPSTSTRPARSSALALEHLDPDLVGP